METTEEKVEKLLRKGELTHDFKLTLRIDTEEYINELTRQANELIKNNSLWCFGDSCGDNGKICGKVTKLNGIDFTLQFSGNVYGQNLFFLLSQTDSYEKCRFYPIVEYPDISYFIRLSTTFKLHGILVSFLPMIKKERIKE
jgi:hypothetical protein